MNRTSPIRARSVRTRLAAGLFAALLGILAGCGGGGGAEPTEPTTSEPVLPGPPVTATIGAAGGEIRFTASGVAGRLQIPAGALAAESAITVTPLAAATGEWARLDLSGIDAVLERPATLTLTLPAGSSLDPAAAVTQTAAVDDILLPATLDPAAREISVPVQKFSLGAVSRALAAGRRAAPPGNPATLILNQRLLVQLRVIKAEARYRELVRFGDFSSTLELSMSIAALLQSSGLDGYDAQARPWLERAATSACGELGLAIDRVASTPAPTELDPEGNVARAFISRVSGPLLYWASIVDRLGASCRGLDPQATLSQAHARLLAVVERKLRERQDLATLKGAVGEAAAAKGLQQQGQTLAAVVPAAPRTLPATLGAQLRDEVMEPTLAPLRAAHWQAAGADATQDPYRLSLAVFGAASPLADDVQMVRTSLQVGSAEGPQALGSGQAGGGATPAQSVRELTLPARKGGRVTVSGPIDVLHCPGAASERLVIDFQGATVLDRAAAGARLLDGSLAFEVDALLAAASIDPATEGTHELRVRRVGSSCNAALGLAADALLVRVRLDFLAGKPPPPSLIAGKSYSGTLVSYYAPFRHPDCSRSCLQPGESRCRVSGDSDFEVSIAGTAAEYTTSTRTRPRLPPEFQPVWNERVFKGRGTTNSAGGLQMNYIASRIPEIQLTLDPATGVVTGTIVGMCSEEEFTLR